MHYVGSFSVVDILKDILNKIKAYCMINTKQLNVADGKNEIEVWMSNKTQSLKM